MKPPPFEYRAPLTLGETLELLSEEPESTSLLAGGQSLVPMLNLRLARPARVVDLNRVEGLDGIAQDRPGGPIRIGAMVRQHTLESSALIREQLPLITEAASHIGHIAIRSRGTVGGSLAHADPAAELPAVMAALGARIVLRSRGGERMVPASEFFEGPLMTALRPGELLVAVEVDVPPAGTGSAFVEVARTHGAFALVATAALVRVAPGGCIDFASLALGGVAGVPYVAGWIGPALAGAEPTAEAFANAVEPLTTEIRWREDEHGAYRRRASSGLAARALRTAAERSRA
ncbi:MAG: FAD binding domain-containing protein [Solirubrobacteraceae bacterium]